MVVAVCGKKGTLRFEQCRFFDLIMGDQRAEDQAVAFFSDPIEPGNAANIQHVSGFRQTHLHQRQQTLSAGKYFHIVLMRGQIFHGVAEGARRVVVEGTGNHD